MTESDPANSTKAPKLRRELTLVDLTMTAIGGLVGSGWLFASMTAATIAGPAAILSWIIGGFGVIVLGLSFAELAGMLPEAGGIIRYPRYTHGRFVSYLIGWAAIISWAGIPPIEAEAVLQYSSSYIHGLYDATSGSLTGPGFLVAAILVAFFFMVNYLGVKLYARINTPLTFIKFAAPLLTIVAFLVVGFHPANFDHYGGGFIPYGWGGVFSAISLGGIIFAYTGFRPMMDLAGEAKNPQRDIPRAFIIAMIGVGILYMLLQIVFIGAVPAHALAKGWSALNYASPYANLAFALNLSWVAIILYGDAIVSPFGTGLVYAAGTPRGILAFARNGYFPKTFEKLTHRATPGSAIILSFVLGIAFLLPFPSWQKLVGVLSSATILTYMMGPVSTMVLRRTGPDLKRRYRLGRLSLWAPIGFVVGSLIFYWTGWSINRDLGLMALLGLIVYVVYFVRDAKRDWSDIKSAVWLLVYMVFMLLWSKLGTFGGTGTIPAPWDEIGVVVVSIPFFYWAVSSGRVTPSLSEAQNVADEVDQLPQNL
ncbi:MAG: APC family permease [Sulfobacillus acidophilus]|uniref:APC family permease n=1 Tax=Sulfobacillus acidophilus TaxID=53633 RepID=A0A2T2WNU5_9FIRM|nr:MAG: APC family permease [Sulfobacillus acidophilus]